MGCVYSNDNDTSKRKPNAAANGNLANGNGPTSGDPVRWNADNNGVSLNGSNQCNDSNNNQSTIRGRLFDVEVYNGDKDATPAIGGKLEITDDSLIYRLKGRSPIIWPLRFLRSYGYDKDIFSFNCGRRCFTGEGVYVFKCSNAEQLFKTLLEVINTATNFNTSSIAINNHLPSTINHSAGGSSNAHEYQNLSPFENDHSNFAPLPPRIPPQIEMLAINRPHSSMSSTEQANHNHIYLNSADPNVIGSKSQPNYYISNSLSGQRDGSRTSLNGALNGTTSPQSSSYDSSTLPQMRNMKYIAREYVNVHNTSTTMDDSFVNRRKNSEQHLYENHEIPPSNVARPQKLEQTNLKMVASDDHSCYENLDLAPRKERHTHAFPQGFKSARTTPEPSSYYTQLDLKNNANSKEARIQAKLTSKLMNKTEVKLEPAPKDNSVLSAETIKANIIVQTTADDDKGKSNKENKENNGQQDTALAKTSSTIPYAQIDFAKTAALSNSAANHSINRKL